MKHIQTFEQFLNESINEASKVIDKNPSDAIPFKVNPKSGYSQTVWVWDDGITVDVEYKDRSKVMPRGRFLTDKTIYDTYIENKFYLFKPISEIWSSISKKLGLKVPSNLPVKSGFHKILVDGNFEIIVNNEIGGRGDERYQDNSLTFKITKNENLDSNLKTIKEFIKEECFYPANTPVPTLDDILKNY